MKLKMIAMVYCLLFLISVTAIPIHGSSLTAEKAEPVFNINATVTRQGESVQELIASLYIPGQFDFFFTALPSCHVDSYYVDPSIYAVEYGLSLEYPAEKLEFSYSDLSLYPKIHLPVFSTIEGETRIIGELTISYDYYRQEYTCLPGMENVSSEDFRSGKNRNFLEMIGITDNYSNISSALAEYQVKNILLLTSATAFNNGSHKLIVAETKDGEFIAYDFMDLLSKSDHGPKAVLPFSEFAAQDSLFHTHDITEIGSGGILASDGQSSIFEYIPKTPWGAICIGISIPLLCGTAVSVIIAKKRKKQRSKPASESYTYEKETTE